MADDELERVEDGAGQAPEPPKKKSLLKLIIIIVAGLLFLGGAAFGAWWFFLAPWPFTAEEQIAQDQPADAAGSSQGQQADAAAATGPDGQPLEPLAPPVAPPGMILNLEPFLVNLADARSKRFLKARLAIDANNELFQQEIELRMPKIRDSLLLLFSSKTSEELATTQGKLKLRNEVLKTINNIMGSAGTVKEAYFLEFVIQ